jgi:hypothetical protein
MNFSSVLAVVLLGFTRTQAFAQDEPDYSTILKGEWVAMESLLTSEIESPLISSYFKYEFADGIVYFSTNDFERGQGSEYSISGDTVKMMGYKYVILSYEDGMLQIETKLALIKAVHTTTLVTKEKYDGLWKLGANGEQNHKTMPVFTGNFHLYDYVFSNYNTPKEYLKYAPLQAYLSMPPLPKEDIFLRVDILVDSIGNVTVQDVRSAPIMNEKRKAKVRKKMEKTSGLWLPAITNGKNQTEILVLTFVNRGKKSLHLKDRAIQHFKMAYQHFQKADYRGAIQRCTDAITLDQTKFQFYVLRAVCNIKLAEIDKYCKDVYLANSLNPFVSLENVEIVNGEALQITCGKN